MDGEHKMDIDDGIVDQMIPMTLEEEQEVFETLALENLMQMIYNNKVRTQSGAPQMKAIRGQLVPVRNYRLIFLSDSETDLVDGNWQNGHAVQESSSAVRMDQDEDFEKMHIDEENEHVMKREDGPSGSNCCQHNDVSSSSEDKKSVAPSGVTRRSTL